MKNSILRAKILLPIFTFLTLTEGLLIVGGTNEASVEVFESNMFRHKQSNVFHRNQSNKFIHTLSIRYFSTSAKLLLFAPSFGRLNSNVICLPCLGDLPPPSPTSKLLMIITITMIIIIVIIIIIMIRSLSFHTVDVIDGTALTCYGSSCLRHDCHASHQHHHHHHHHHHHNQTLL